MSSSGQTVVQQTSSKRHRTDTVGTQQRHVAAVAEDTTDVHMITRTVVVANACQCIVDWRDVEPELQDPQKKKINIIFFRSPSFLCLPSYL